MTGLMRGWSLCGYCPSLISFIDVVFRVISIDIFPIAFDSELILLIKRFGGVTQMFVEM